MNNLNNAEEIIDLEVHSKEDKHVPTGKRYRVKIGDEYFVFDHHLVTGKEILEKACASPIECFWLYQKFKGCDFERISPDETVDLAKPGLEHFVVKPTEVFNYFVDGEPEMTDKKELTPREIMQLAGIDPAKHYLVLKLEDGKQISYKDKPDEKIKMRCPAMHFISINNGEMTVS